MAHSACHVVVAGVAICGGNIYPYPEILGCCVAVNVAGGVSGVAFESPQCGVACGRGSAPVSASA